MLIPSAIFSTLCLSSFCLYIYETNKLSEVELGIMFYETTNKMANKLYEFEEKNSDFLREQIKKMDLSVQFINSLTEEEKVKYFSLKK